MLEILLFIGFISVASLFVIVPLVAHPTLTIKQRSLYTISLITGSGMMIALLYLKLGAYDAWKESMVLQEDRAQYQQIFDRFIKQGLGVDKLNHAVKAELKKRPESIQGWFVLGKIAMSQGSTDEAIEAFKKAYDLESRDPDILAAYIQALYAKNSQMTPEIRILVDTLLLSQPNHEGALNILAKDAFDNGRYMEAIDNWEKILIHYDSGSGMAEALAAAIATARERMENK